MRIRRLPAIAAQFLFFELGKVFAPFGRIYSLEVYEQLMLIPNAIGAKHSSLRRNSGVAAARIAKSQFDPTSKCSQATIWRSIWSCTAAITCLVLSTFAPKAFAKPRRNVGIRAIPRFYELNDLLQYLGAFAFRDPAPAYKHSAAMFLKLRGLLKDDRTHPGSPTSSRFGSRGLERRSLVIWRNFSRRAIDGLSTDRQFQVSFGLRRPHCRFRAGRFHVIRPFRRATSHLFHKSIAFEDDQDRQPVLHSSDGRLGRYRRRGSDRTHASTVAKFRYQWCEADVGRGGGCGSPRRPRKSQPAFDQ